MIVEFKMWSIFHYFMIIFPFLLAVILYLGARNKSEQVRRKVGLVLAIIMILILIVRNSYIWIEHGTFNSEVIPFQVCHFGNFIFLITALSRSTVWSTMAWCLNFPAGLVSVVFADGLVNNYTTMINTQAITYITGHMLLVTAGFYMLLAGLIRINWRSMKKMFLLVGCGYFLSVAINSWFNRVFAHTTLTANYFYTYMPEAGTPLEMMFDLGQSYTLLGIAFNPIYLLLLGLAGAIVMLAMYGIYKLKGETHSTRLTFSP